MYGQLWNLVSIKYTILNKFTMCLFFSCRVMIDGGTTLLTFNVTSQSFPCLRISSNIGNAHLGKSSLRKRTTESSAILFSCYFSNCIRNPSTESTFDIYDKGGVRLTASHSSALSLYYCLWRGGGCLLPK